MSIFGELKKLPIYRKLLYAIIALVLSISGVYKAFTDNDPNTKVSDAIEEVQNKYEDVTEAIDELNIEGTSSNTN